MSDSSLVKTQATAISLPTAAEIRNVVRFETLIVAINYMGSGQNVLLGTFKWGWTGQGATPTHSSTIDLKGGTPSQTTYDILKYDYSTFKFF